jgi:hypothetical protein
MYELLYSVCYPNTAASSSVSDTYLYAIVRSFHSFIHQWLYSPLLGPGLFFSFVIIFTQAVGLLGRVISPLQGRYLHMDNIETE